MSDTNTYSHTDLDIAWVNCMGLRQVSGNQRNWLLEQDTHRTENMVLLECYYTSNPRETVHADNVGRLDHFIDDPFVGGLWILSECLLMVPLVEQHGAIFPL